MFGNVHLRRKGEDAGARDACIRRTQTGMHMYVRFFFFAGRRHTFALQKRGPRRARVSCWDVGNTHTSGGRASGAHASSTPGAVRARSHTSARTVPPREDDVPRSSWTKVHDVEKVSHACAGVTSRASAGGSGGGARAESAGIDVRAGNALQTHRRVTSSQTRSALEWRRWDTHREERRRRREERVLHELPLGVKCGGQFVTVFCNARSVLFESHIECGCVTASSPPD